MSGPDHHERFLSWSAVTSSGGTRLSSSLVIDPMIPDRFLEVPIYAPSY